MEKVLKQEGSTKEGVFTFIDRDGKILLGLRQYKPDRAVWIPPGGRCCSGERLEETLRREVEEEVGITDFELLGYLSSVPGLSEGDTVHLFHAHTAQDFEHREPEKFVEWRWFALQELPEQIGAITADDLRSYLNVAT